MAMPMNWSWTCDSTNIRQGDDAPWRDCVGDIHFQNVWFTIGCTISICSLMCVLVTLAWFRKLRTRPGTSLPSAFLHSVMREA